MSRFPMEEVHISLIRVGDIVLHDGSERTVGGSDIRRGFMGHTLFGDSYRLGLQAVKKICYPR